MIALGSNLGDREATLRQGWERLGHVDGVRALRLSRFYDTAPVGGPKQPRYLNAAGLIETTCEPAMEPHELLETLQQIETAFDRVRTERWGPRTLDLDLLLFGEQTINTEQLIVPHPRMTERLFVLEPAAEIAPNLMHPVEKLTVRQLLERLR